MDAFQIKNINGLVIRYDHDDLIFLLRRAKLKDLTVVNFDRHHDCRRDKELDVGSWAYVGKKEGLIKKYVWVPPIECLCDKIRRAAALRRLKRAESPIVLSICYDYFIGHKLKARGLEKAIEDIFACVGGKHILFIYCARSPEWCRRDQIAEVEHDIKRYFESRGFTQSPYSQPFLRKPRAEIEVEFLTKKIPVPVSRRSVRHAYRRDSLFLSKV